MYFTEALINLGSRLEGNIKQLVLVHILQSIPVYNLTEALDTTLAIQDDEYRTESLITLIPQLEGDLLTQTLQAALTIENEEYRAKTLIALIPKLDDDLLNQVFQAALVIKNEEYRLMTLRNLVPSLNDEQLNQVLRVALAAKDEWGHVKILIDLAERLKSTTLTTISPHLADELLAQALQSILAIDDEWGYRHDGALTWLAPYLEGDLLRQALQVTLIIADKESYIRALDALISVSPLKSEFRQLILTQALQTSLAANNQRHRANALTILAPLLEGEDKELALTEALWAVLAVEFERSRAISLAALVPLLMNKLLPQVLQSALQIDPRNCAIQVLVAVASRLENNEKKEVLNRALQLTFTIELDWERAKSLASLVSELDDEIKQATLIQAVEAITLLAVKSEWLCSDAITALAPYLEGKLLNKVLQITLAMKEGQHQAISLIALIPQLEGETKQKMSVQTLQITLDIKDKKKRAEALTALIPQLKGELLTQALYASLAIEHEDNRAKALTALALQVKGKQLTQALQKILAIKHEEVRIQTLIVLAPHLQGTELIQLQTTLRSTIIEGLVNWQHKSRQDILYFLSIKDLFTPTALGVPTAGMVEAIVGHIHEICTQWRWG